MSSPPPVASRDFSQDRLATAYFGLRKSFGFSIGIFIFGGLFGATASSANISFAQAMAMSGFLLAGSVQFPTLALFADPMPFAAIAMVTVLVASRFTLMGVALEPRFRKIPRWQLWPAVSVITDPIWVMLSDKTVKVEPLAFLLAVSAQFILAWMLGTALGYHGATMLDAELRQVLAFGGTLFLVGLISILARSSATPLSALAVAGGIAIVLDPLLPKALSLPLATLIGASVGAAMIARRQAP